MKAMTHDGRALRILTVIEEYTRECLALRVARRLGSLQVIETLADVMLVHGITGAHTFGQRTRVYCGRVAKVAGSVGYEDVVHRTWESVGERVLREFQREVAGRVLEWRDLLLAEGGPDSDGAVAGGIQHGASTLGARLEAAGTASHLAEETGAWRCGKQNPFSTSPHPRRRLRTKLERGVTLTFHLVQKIGQVSAALSYVQCPFSTVSFLPLLS